MAVVCGKCNHFRKEIESAPDWQCPACGVAYNKVQRYSPAPSVSKTQPAKPLAAETPAVDSELEQVATGQKLMLYAILLNIILVSIKTKIGPVLLLLLALAVIIMSIVGILKLLSGLGYGITEKVLQVVLQFIPVVNLICLVLLNVRANKALRAAGYEVGLLGVKS